MKQLNDQQKQNIYGGVAATTVLAIGSCVAAGISLLTNVVFGALNVVNATKQKGHEVPLQYSKTTNNLVYTNIV